MSEIRRAVFAGSFDPPTIGHLDIVSRASALFDEVLFCLMVNPQKHYSFSEEERLSMMKAITKDLPNVRVDVYHGLVVDYAVENHARFIVKGIRNGVDLEYENTMAYYNKRLAPSVETVYLAAAPENVYISSSGVRELLAFGGSIKGLVPEMIEQDINDWRKKS